MPRQVKVGWRIYLDDGRWISRLGIGDGPNEKVLFVIPFTNFRVMLQRPHVATMLIPGEDF